MLATYLTENRAFDSCIRWCRGCVLKKAARIREAFWLLRSKQLLRQCLLLKSRKEPLGGVGTRLLGVVASQIIFDKPRSIGAMVIANRYMIRNASANIMSIPAETRIASRMTGITAPLKTVISLCSFQVYTMIWKLKGIIACSGIERILSKTMGNEKKVVHFFEKLGYCSKLKKMQFRGAACTSHKYGDSIDNN